MKTHRTLRTTIALAVVFGAGCSSTVDLEAATEPTPLSLEVEVDNAGSDVEPVDTASEPTLRETPDPDSDPTPDPSPDPQPTPRPQPTPGPRPTPDPTPGETPDPPSDPTPDPTPGETPDPPSDPTPDPTPEPVAETNIVTTPVKLSLDPDCFVGLPDRYIDGTAVVLVDTHGYSPLATTGGKIEGFNAEKGQFEDRIKIDPDNPTVELTGSLVTVGSVEAGTEIHVSVHGFVSGAIQIDIDEVLRFSAAREFVGGNRGCDWVMRVGVVINEK